MDPEDGGLRKLRRRIAPSSNGIRSTRWWASRCGYAGRIIGTVTAARCREDESFTPDDLKLLEELGERAAAAIENARLHREAVNAGARAEQLYRFAQSVVAADGSRSFSMPRSPPSKRRSARHARPS